MTDLPTTATEFSSWRKAQAFTDPHIAQTAALVERDLRNIEAAGDKAPETAKRMAAAYRANFAAMLNASAAS